jgi:ABC-type dipeptide/oligopeptide/nickel transport system permease component
VSRRLRFLITRVAGMLLTLFAVLTFTFVLTFAVPQDPARSVVGPKGTAAQIKVVRQDLGLNDPMLVQYGRYLANVATGNIG